jgi:hypothetical protein
MRCNLFCVSEFNNTSRKNVDLGKQFLANPGTGRNLKIFSHIANNTLHK